MENASNVSFNFIDIGGRICSDFIFSHEIYAEGFYRFDVEVERLSGSADILPVTVSERIIDRAAMVPGAHVRIIGQIRSYNNYVEVERKNKLVLTVFARDIEIQTPQSESSPNEVFLNGYLCKPPIYRTTPFGREIADMLLAVNRSYNKSDYIPCIAWGRNARFAGKLPVGENIRLWGRMQSRIYQKKKDDGEVQEKTAYEVSIAKVEVAQEPEEAITPPQTLYQRI
ncbi:MAG: single-stranded DNA-binding protein [Defluviitaleaceae bacterium]|nr:single-stranded DNA-binding protein [Defluviitaleaceae bacterium]MCL2239494.1 single-stranded DNA-binding protein [Defluviitaleaceae bacterium]